MLIGALLDNLNEPADSSYTKLRNMRANCVGLLWTGGKNGGGTKHARAVYQRCERELDKPEYILRIDGYDDTPAGWFEAARDALQEVPDVILAEDRLLATCRNEPNLEGFAGRPTEYGELYRVVKNSSIPVLFACPSLGIDGWSQWLYTALEAAGGAQYGIVNLYAENVGRIGDFAGIFGELYVGEVNSPPWMHDGLRVEFMGQAFRTLRRAGVKASLVFIAGGKSWGSWDENYIISDDEARGIGNIEREVQSMKLSEQYPELYDQWVGAGGIENNFRAHLLGIGALKATKDDVRLLGGELQAKLTQLTNVVNALPFA